LASGVYPTEFEEICRHCYLDPELCPEWMYRPTTEQYAVCPLRVAVKHKLSAIQGKQLSETARLRGYTPEKFLKMVRITVERNQLAAVA
jgi:hypothetical protein